MNVMAFGPGEPVLIVHGGFSGNYELWLQPFDILSRRWRCVTYDHRGAGENRAEGRITRQDMVADLFGIMDVVGVERAVLAGESMGCGIVLDAALQQPQRIAGLVLVDGSPAYSQQRSGALAAGVRAQFLPTLQAFIERGVPEDGMEHVRRWGMHILTRSTPVESAELLECMWGLDLTERLADVKAPTLIIHGERDQIIPMQVAELMSSRIPGSRLVTAPGIGHVPTLTAPEMVANEIARFLETVVL